VTETLGTHPSPERLVAFRLGRLQELEAGGIRRHLDDCPSCRSLAEALEPESLRLLLQDAGATATPPPLPEAATIVPAATPAGDATAIPTELADHSRYRLIEVLGSGGMGCVYRAEHRLMERPVALKVISRELTRDPAAVERFRREVKTAARLSHPNIVTAHDAEQANDLHFLVMEYVEGVSLDRLVEQRGRLPVAQACEYVRQAALGLQHAHERGMVHRDIKPQNLMLTPQGQVKVLDFGLARFVSDSQPTGPLTKLGSIMGTPDYISPEQANDSRTADIRGDIYSLGCTLYYLLTARVPFPDGSLLQKLMAHVEKQPQPITELRGDLPDGLVSVLNRMMAKDPARRYQSPGEAAQALLPFTLPVASVPDFFTVAPLASVVPSVPPAPTPAPEAPTTVEPVLAEVVPAGPTVPEANQRIRMLALASILLGVLALPHCLCLGMGRIPISIIGLALGAVAFALARKQAERSLGLPILGTALNAVAFVLAVSY
jgi:predicted Ser/Thr protein kinase